MEINLVVSLEPWPIEPKVTFDIGILFSIIDGSNEVKGVTPLPIVMLAKATSHYGGITYLTFFDMIAKEERANLVIQIDFYFQFILFIFNFFIIKD